MEQLSYAKTVNFLNKNRLNFAKSKLCKDVEQAKKEAKKIGFPVAIKVISPDIIHKSDAGVVKTGINDENELEREFRNILKKSKKVSRKKIEGILVQKMYTGKEVIIGLKRDMQFGGVVLFGIGGIFTEVLKDFSLRIAPVDKKEALNMIKEIKGFPILAGARGKKSVNLDAVALMITKLSKAAGNKKIQEIDLNPVVVNEKEAVIVDVRVIVEK